MRIDHLEISNFKGIAHAVMTETADQPVIMISGRNGTGKSLVLEALVGFWSGRYPLQRWVGPWGDEATLEVGIHLSGDELTSVGDWHQRQTGSPLPARDVHVLRQTGNRLTDSSAVSRMDEAIGVLRNANFQRENPFAVIDFLPATRNVPSSPSPTVDLAMLNIDRVESERITMLDRFMNDRTIVSLPNITSYLITLDYQNFLAQRQGLELSNEYERIASAFSEATGKRLLEPGYETSKGSNIEVEVATGHRHALNELSAGEQEVLALMYFVRRLSAAGGVLCLDEPEQHLHPTLQAALFEVMNDLAERAQVIAVTHSVNLIGSVPVEGLFQMAAPTDPATNQISRLRDEPERLHLIATLGITPAHILQSDLICVVEGDTDQQWLRATLPLELSRAHFLIAGSGRQVVDAYDTLAAAPETIPWICIRDRDLMSETDVAALRGGRPNLWIWPRRELESVILDPGLLSDVLTTAGRTTSREEANELFVAAAAPLKQDVLESLVETELSRRYPPPTSTTGSRWEQLEAGYRQYATINEQRASGMIAVLAEQEQLLDARWTAEWTELVDPKIVFARLATDLGVFRDSQALMTALFARARDESTLRPASLEQLRVRLLQLLGRGVEPSG